VSRITSQKRQKERKRQEKQRMKAEKRAQRKVAKHAMAEAALHQLEGVPESQVSQALRGQNESEAG
jgi:hypothetical protein